MVGWLVGWSVGKLVETCLTVHVAHGAHRLCAEPMHCTPPPRAARTARRAVALVDHDQNDGLVGAAAGLEVVLHQLGCREKHAARRPGLRPGRLRARGAPERGEACMGCG